MKIEKIELKHICGYLPHGLKFVSELDKPFDEFVDNPIWTMNGISFLFGEHCITTKENNDAYPISLCKPLLLPLSALIEPLEDGTVPIDEFFILYGGGVSDSAKKYWKKDFVDNILYSPIEAISFGVVEKLLEWHFDIFYLIGSELAIDKRTVKL